KWTRISELHLKAFPQTSQETGRSPSPPGTRPEPLLLFLTLQEYSFSRVWVVMWTLRWLLLLKHFPQVAQEYGRSPVWLRVWRSSVVLWLKQRPHVVHWYDFSPVWILIPCPSFLPDPASRLHGRRSGLVLTHCGQFPHNQTSLGSYPPPVSPPVHLHHERRRLPAPL
uniref:Uncharacterized protein n=1 Tax=Xiphophorus maculatus TaxID=8083 RepID=A0A3B5QFR2_XIPMA